MLARRKSNGRDASICASHPRAHRYSSSGWRFHGRRGVLGNNWLDCHNAPLLVGMGGRRFNGFLASTWMRSWFLDFFQLKLRSCLIMMPWIKATQMRANRQPSFGKCGKVSIPWHFKRLVERKIFFGVSSAALYMQQHCSLQGRSINNSWTPKVPCSSENGGILYQNCSNHCTLNQMQSTCRLWMHSTPMLLRNNWLRQSGQIYTGVRNWEN